MATIGSWRRLGALAAGGVVALGLAACEKADPAAEAINKASTELEMLAIGGGKAPLNEDRLREGYTSVLTSLRAAESGAAGPRRGAAASLAAQAQLGLAALAMDDAMEMELACARKQAEIRNLQNHWTDLKSLQASLEAFDPAGEIARLEEERTARAAEVTAAQQRLSEANADLDALRARIESLEGQANAKWREETEIRKSAVDMGEVDRAPLIEQANEVKRQGDALDRQASEAKAMLDSKEPGLRDIEAEIDRLTTQSEQLSHAIESLRAERTERVELSGQTAEEAGGLADRIAGLVGELQDLREGAPAAWQAVADACDAAQSKAGGASGDLAQIQAGAAAQTLADALSHQAAGCEAQASTMRLLADTQPALPDAAAYAAAAESAAQKAGELRDSAKAAYGEAAGAFGALGGEGDRVAEAMTQLSKALKAKAGEPAAEGVSPAGEPTESQTPAAPEPAPAGEESAG